MRMKCGDTKLLKHSENIALNATYMSVKVQNDLISICGDICQKEIVKCLNEAEVFSVLVDETADISGHKQLSLCVRYTKKVETCYAVKEDFLGFVKVDNTTEQPLADTIIASLKNLDIDCNNIVEQGYDGAAVMKGAFNGVQAIIRKSFPRALFVHCRSHYLNLALCHSCSVPPIRNCIGSVKAIGNFLRASPKRTSFLQARIRANFPDATWQKLTPMCETRWVENHNGFLKFKQIYKSIIETLEQFSIDPDMETSTKASSFLRSALASEFVVSLCFLAKADINEEIKVPRLTSTQKHRANPNTNNPEQYYRIIVAIPLSKDSTHQLKIIFTDHKKVIAAMYTLIPSLFREGNAIPKRGPSDVRGPGRTRRGTRRISTMEIVMAEQEPFGSVFLRH
ncbi:unnamed protein product [Phaedon cochleariae]|uniref:DUF4371 domain-containing protein n=1 Tax=Phaedon cochleariae TaxID=80249 RepID=A0A9P0GYD5_PHACE|nr:unnamed protein product [Phaedon cochleariae]